MSTTPNSQRNNSDKQCPYAKLTGHSNPCDIYFETDEAVGCYACQTITSKIPEKCAAVLNEPSQVQEAVAAFLSQDLSMTRPRYRLTLFTDGRRLDLCENEEDIQGRLAEIEKSQANSQDDAHCTHYVEHRIVELTDMSDSTQIRLEYNPAAHGQTKVESKEYSEDLVAHLSNPLRGLVHHAATTLLAKGFYLTVVKTDDGTGEKLSFSCSAQLKPVSQSVGAQSQTSEIEGVIEAAIYFQQVRNEGNFLYNEPGR